MKTSSPLVVEPCLALSQPLALAPTQAQTQAPTPQPLHPRMRKQSGFTLVELLVVLVAIAVLAVIFFPNVKSIFIGSRVTPTVNELASALMRIRANNASNGSTTPYTGIDAANLAITLRDRTNAMVVEGEGGTTTVKHLLGSTGSLVAVAATALPTQGDSFKVTFSTVNDGACPDLASGLVGSSEQITINTTQVFASQSSGLTAKPYDAKQAQKLCLKGNLNVFEFYVR